jgi:hypothetical protein
VPARPNPYTCTTHPDSSAAWRCLACEQQLCEACAAPGAFHNTAVVLPLCSHCGGGTVPLTVPGVEQPFNTLLSLTLTLPVGMRTAGVLLAVVMGSGMLSNAAHQSGLLWGAMLIVASLLLASLTAILLQASAQGLGRLGNEPDDVGQPLVAPALRLWPLTAFLLALPQLAESAPRWRSGFSFNDVLIFLVGGLVGPFLSLGLVLGRPLDIARRLPGIGADLWRTAGLTGFATLLLWHFLAAAAYIERTDPQLSFFVIILHAVSLLVVLWLARLHGTLLHVHAPALDYMLPASLRVPVAPDARPRGTPYRPPAPPPREVKPLELDLEPDAPALDALMRALEARDAEGTLAAFARLDASQRALLSPDTYVQVGKAAASRGEWERAREAFMLGTRVRTQHPATATACVLLARLLAERFGDPTTAASFYRHVAKHYPQTEAAAFARSRLGPSA